MGDRTVAEAGNVTLGSILAGRRVAARHRQKDLAGLIGVSEDRIYKIENDKSVPSVTDFMAWCRACDVDPCAVMTELPEYHAAAPAAAGA